MFCYQCEQAAQGKGCEKVGVCGKDPETSDLQDVLTVLTRGIAAYARRAADLGWHHPATEEFVIGSLFTTVTNVNFDAAVLRRWIAEAVAVRSRARDAWLSLAGETAPNTTDLPVSATWTPSADAEELARQAGAQSIPSRVKDRGDTLVGLEELVLYGLKGAAAYADHARILGRHDSTLAKEFLRILDILNNSPDQATLLQAALDAGQLNLKVMEILDRAHTDTFGHPVPTTVRTTAVKGKAILVSGHDLPDLKALLDQTQGTGINVYTHGEMLPAHGYPELKKYSHLAGNYGGAWQDQRAEFDAFPGAILMTTNCIQKPRESYSGRIFTCGLVRWPGVTHLENRQFGPAIQAAQAAPGFAQDEAEHTITVGFGHHAVLSVAGAVVDAVKAGQIRHFFLVGGCDGAKPGRNYYTDFAANTPKDTVVLTLACGKYRFNKLDFGDIGGIPRLLDVGQCNDAYSAIRIASALADAFKTDVNSLPLSLVLSWYEQKAVAILLTLLALGIKNIRLGPSLPAFVTPPVLGVLVEAFGLKPVGDPIEDIQACLAK
jgi:hydroxylamine reductase